MSIHDRVDRLIARLHDAPQYPTQGAVLFVDLAAQTTRRAWLSTGSAGPSLSCEIRTQAFSIGSRS